MGKSLKFNGEAVTQSHRIRVRTMAGQLHIQEKISSERGAQTRRQKFISVTLPKLKTQEEMDVD